MRPAERHLQQAKDREGFWIGLKNLTDQARAVCLADVSYGVIDAAHGAGATVEGFSPSMSPHTCATPNGARLVLPGETLFVYGAVPVPEWAADPLQRDVPAPAEVAAMPCEREPGWTLAGFSAAGS